MNEAPSTIHGYSVIASQPTEGHGIDRAGFVILVDRGQDVPHRWVTAWLGQGDRDWTWGHYFLSEASGRDDYAYRCRRGY